MTVRTTTESVTFGHSFTLGEFEEILPPGTYDVDTDEELLEGLSFQAYRRVLTVIRLPTASGDPSLMRALTIDPNDLDAAISRDQETTAPTA
jgi:hypothetical protein